ncbi:MAG: hypothetical protein E7012_04690 [Alphaproteobacteria bacterium]|nr:hypothetical protein [Alphaproteobacteria bacterium]
MKKILLLILLFSVILSTANAKVTLVVDWKSEMPKRVNNEKMEPTSCETKCLGYSIKTTYCYDYEKMLQSCPEYGCSHYYKCVTREQ